MTSTLEDGRSTTATPQKPRGKAPAQQLNETITEIAILQAYARSVGKRIPERVLDTLALLTDWTHGVNTQPADLKKVTQENGPESVRTPAPEGNAPLQPPSLSEPPPTEEIALPTLGEQLKLALSAHGQLSELVAPATVQSLRATDPDQPLRSWLKQVWVVPLILLLTILAFVALVATQANLQRLTRSTDVPSAETKTPVAETNTPVSLGDAPPRSWSLARTRVDSEARSRA